MATTATRQHNVIGRGSRELQFVSFALGDQAYGVAVADVHGIYHGLPIIPNPDNSPFLEGDVQLADKRIPVINLRRFAGMTDAKTCTAPRWILLFETVGGPIGLVVDRVIEVLRLEASSIEQPTDNTMSPVRDYITAVANHNGRTMYLPDFTRLVHDAVQ